jgi:hypothetical protein
MAEDDSPNHAPTAAYLALAVGLGGILIAVLLRVTGLIADWILLVLIAVFVLAAIVVYAFPRLEELNLRQLSIRLREVKAVEQRIYARWDKLRELSIEPADAINMHNSSIGRMFGTEQAERLLKWQKNRVTKILDLIDATPEEKDHLARFVRPFEIIYEWEDRPDSEEKQRIMSDANRKILELFERETS